MRPSFSTCEAAVATFGDVVFAGALCCDRALPAALFDFAPVDLDCKVFDAALELVAFAFAIIRGLLDSII